MILPFMNEKGGVGKSRLATVIAAAAAADGIDVALLDTDRQGASMRWSRQRVSEAIEPSFPTFQVTEKPTHEIEKLSTKFPLLVVDLAAGSYLEIPRVAQLADLVIVPCGVDQDEIVTTFRTLEQIVAVSRDHPRGYIPTWIVLTRMPPQENSRIAAATRQIFQDLVDQNPGCGLELFPVSMTSRDAWRASGRTGRGLHELRSAEKSAKALEEIGALYQAIKRFSTKSSASNTKLARVASI